MKWPQKVKLLLPNKRLQGIPGHYRNEAEQSAQER